jgi:hypothetical protein
MRVTLAGEPLDLRPSFECLVQIEQTLGKSMLALARSAVSEAGLTINEMATIIKSGADAFADAHNTGNVFNTATIAGLILKEGLVPSLAAVVRFLEAAVLGGAEPAKGEAGKVEAPRM